MSQSFDDPLEQKVDQVKEKADRAERANDLEAEVQRAKDNIDGLARDLRRLDSFAEDLIFYDDVLTRVFGDRRIDAVDRAIQRTQEVSSISDEEVLDAAENRETTELTRSVEDAQEVVRHARSETIEEVRSHQRDWESEIEAARDLNQIIGGAGSDFDDVIRDMESFLNEDIWNENRSIDSLEAQWNNLTEKWSQNAGKHGWEAFKNEYELSGDTMDILRQFAEQGTVRLNEVTNDIIREMKGIEELESAVRMEIDTQ